MKVHNLSGGYSGKLILENINFHIEEGKTYALLGLNGAGKTTLIKMICGFIKVDSGNVVINNQNILNLTEKKRARLISYVPQRSNIVYFTTVVDVVLMGATPYLNTTQTPDKRHRQQAKACLEELGIEELADSNFLNLSEGQKQLVLIARALMQNGKYMILDEPDSSLDLLNKHRLMKKMKEIIIRNNKGAIISMHSPEYALNYCDKLLLLKDKKIKEVDLYSENIENIETYLREIYGPIKVMKYERKYILFYNE